MSLEEVGNHAGVDHDHVASGFAGWQRMAPKGPDDLYQPLCSLGIKLCIILQYFPGYRSLDFDTGKPSCGVSGSVLFRHLFIVLHSI